MESSRRPYHPIYPILIVLIPLILACVSSAYVGTDPLKSKGFALFTSCVVLWIFEIIPIALTALLVPVLMILYGVRAVEDAFAPFSSSIIFLFIGAFLLAISFQKHGLDRRVACYLLSFSFFSRTPKRLLIAFSLLSFVFSMWISNTAAVAILVPLVASVSAMVSSMLIEEERDDNLALLLLLGVGYSATIGGIATPVGSPPNLITVAFLRKQGVEVSFGDWMVFATPIAVAMFLVLMYLLLKLFPIPQISSKGHMPMAHRFREMLEAQGPLSSAELQVLFCFLGTILLWLLPDIADLLFSDDVRSMIRARLPLAVSALFGASILFFLRVSKDGLPNLVWEDAQGIDWGTILLFGGGLSLGAMLHETGLAADICSALFSGGRPSVWMLTLLVGTLTLLFTEVASNTASASIFLSVVSAYLLEQMPEAGIEPLLFIGIAASFGFMMPVATPPNAIVFSTGKVPLRVMIRTGFILNLFGLLIATTVILGLKIHRYVL